jgi:hypothetical protein
MRHSKALMRAESSAKRARARLAQMRSAKNPNLMTIGSVALGGALPAVVVEQSAMIPNQIAGLPTEGLIGAGLLVASHQFKGDTKKIVEGLGEGMIAVTAYKLAQRYTGA